MQSQYKAEFQKGAVAVIYIFARIQILGSSPLQFIIASEISGGCEPSTE